MSGMNANTGRRITGIDHIRQSVRDILTTPIGSRVMRREYGSLISELLDRPLNDATLMQIYAATVMAIIRWERRFSVINIRFDLSTSSPGKGTIEIDGLTQSGQRETIRVSIT